MGGAVLFRCGTGGFIRARQPVFYIRLFCVCFYIRVLHNFFEVVAMSNAPLSVRKAVEGLEPYVPGKSIDEIRQLYGLDNIIKMASNENPLGASPLVQKALARAAGQVFRYTQSGNPRLAHAVGAAHGVGPECVVLGNGSDEVIDLLIRCKAEPGVHNIVTFKPCFSLYPIQGKLCGVETRRIPLNDDFTFDWAKLLAAVDENTALVFVTTPDNPSGYCPPVEQVEALAKALPKSALLVIDEAYMDFAASGADGLESGLERYSLLPRIKQFDNVAILRTFSKSYGLAGLRLGYGIMPAPLAEYLCRARPPFSVNILAEAAGLAALGDMDFRKATLAAVHAGRGYLSRELQACGFKVYPSLSNFIMVGLPADAKLDADGLFGALLRRGIIIRQLKSYGLPQLLRISVGNEHENREFVKAVHELLG